MDNQEIRIITEQCDGCGACTESCPYGAIRLEGGKASIDYAECTG
jgi:ferredoxin